METEWVSFGMPGLGSWLIMAGWTIGHSPTRLVVFHAKPDG